MNSKLEELQVLISQMPWFQKIDNLTVNLRHQTDSHFMSLILIPLGNFSMISVLWYAFSTGGSLEKTSQIKLLLYFYFNYYMIQKKSQLLEPEYIVDMHQRLLYTWSCWTPKVNGIVNVQCHSFLWFNTLLA